ncbi:hypothetical protein M8542_30760 [Amycolatopsis sp. OK19-0408]|uniref:Secreted protein n=1 Tax=Amycolatopsis iheyensis TaxID=2945988 RepID=A0A9X2NID0_9PSEU|nr:hypothetical protein [Amycolatopsis iheyensis]MCR6487219.1 hypothetical protein [Amycolatopsis iheyensis]
MRLPGRSLLAAGVASLAVTGVVTGAVLAHGEPSAATGRPTLGLAAAQNASAATDDQQPPLVEDYTYPGADRILATDNVLLVSGDGHIVYATCPTGPDTIGLIWVTTSEHVGPAHNGKVCFRVLGASGQLSLKIPAVYSIRGDGLNPGEGHKLKAALTTDAGVHTTVDVPSDGTTQVGVAATPSGDPTTLLELKTAS